MPHVPYTPKHVLCDALLRFADAMQGRLNDNLHKGSWAGYSSQELFSKANRQTFALQNTDKAERIAAAINAANYLMMLFDNEVSKDAI